MTTPERDLLERVRMRLVEENAAWTSHWTRFHRRGGAAGWWDCLPYLGAYGDGLLQEVEDALGVPEVERVG